MLTCPYFVFIVSDFLLLIPTEIISIIILKLHYHQSPPTVESHSVQLNRLGNKIINIQQVTNKILTSNGFIKFNGQWKINEKAK